MSDHDDPVLHHARREAIWIFAAWAAATAYSCVYSYLFGYTRPHHPLGPRDVHPVFGIPSWFFLGVIAPWGVCALFTFWFAGVFMKEDDLGEDHIRELDEELRAGGGNGS
jgi:Protein of unknown function (DUF997)